MSKIDKTDIENIKLITAETKLTKITKIKIKKGDYEIELSAESEKINNAITNEVQKTHQKIKNLESYFTEL